MESLIIRSIMARPVLLQLERPVVARIATMTDWPLILIDLHTEEGVVGRSYLEPYAVKSMRWTTEGWSGSRSLSLTRTLTASRSWRRN